MIVGQSSNVSWPHDPRTRGSEGTTTSKEYGQNERFMELLCVGGEGTQFSESSFVFFFVKVLSVPYILYLNFMYFVLSIKNFFYLFLALLGLGCFAQFFSSSSELGLLFLAVCGLLIVGAPHCGGSSCCGAWAREAGASVVAAHGCGCCSSAHGIFPD